MKKLVIIPTFASAHFLEHWIPNMQEIIQPDLILIREAFFWGGIENKGHVDNDEFKSKWIYPGTNAGFDWEETCRICSEYANVILDTFTPANQDANKAFLESITLNLDQYVEVGDVVFVLEPDVFIHENDKDKIDQYVSQLEIGHGYRLKWVDFLETQYYTELINIHQPKIRRFCYRFDNIDNFRAAMDGYMSQSYPRLKQIDDMFVFHYAWWNPGKYRQLRYDLIHRSDPKYWTDFEAGLQQIRNVKVWDRNLMNGELVDRREINIPDKITLRPSRHDEGRFAKFIDVDHPFAIKPHPNFVK
jgi:hypothetical protein